MAWPVVFEISDSSSSNWIKWAKGWKVKPVLKKSIEAMREPTTTISKIGPQHKSKDKDKPIKG